MSQDIEISMRNIFKTYNNLRTTQKGSVPSSGEGPNYWDVIILTTFDAVQKESFEQQISIKQQNGHFPEVPIHVVADPPNQKLGVGGSTLHVLAEMTKEYGDELHHKRLLIIHSGGSSQRLPSYSVLGKIFSPVPVKELAVGASSCQMLDLKLAMYLPFCQLLGPGVFVTCADDIETYCLDQDQLDMQALNGADVVALAHPSDIETGEGHGVYVFEECITKVSSSTCSVQECVEVLQKPSQETMRLKGAVIAREENGCSREEIWSDSVFWLSAKLYPRLLTWFSNNQPLPSELDAYAHFLPCLGSRMKNAKPSDFSDFRSDMLPLLKNCCFQLILLNKSKFYHLGTMEEYLIHFNVLDDFTTELGLVKNTSNLVEPIKLSNKNNFGVNKALIGTVIDSFFSDTSVAIILTRATQIVIENSQVHIPLQVEGRTIISNCNIGRNATVTFLFDKISLFQELLYHTVPVLFKDQTLYVTVAFDLTASMKKTSQNPSDIQIYNTSLSDVINYLGFKMEHVLSNNNKISLWTAKLFVGQSTPSESFWCTHHNINKVFNKLRDESMQTKVEISNDLPLFSMEDIVLHKNMTQLLKDKAMLESLLHM